MNDAYTAAKRVAMRELAAIPGFRGLEIEGKELVVYVVSRADEAALPPTIEGLRLRAVVAEKLREERNRGEGFAESGTYRIHKAKQPLTRKAAG
jgi:hypothetical protein